MSDAGAPCAVRGRACFRHVTWGVISSEVGLDLGLPGEGRRYTPFSGKYGWDGSSAGGADARTHHARHPAARPANRARTATTPSGRPRPPGVALRDVLPDTRSAPARRVDLETRHRRRFRDQSDRSHAADGPPSGSLRGERDRWHGTDRTIPANPGERSRFPGTARADRRLSKGTPVRAPVTEGGGSPRRPRGTGQRLAEEEDAVALLLRPARDARATGHLVDHGAAGADPAAPARSSTPGLRARMSEKKDNT